MNEPKPGDIFSFSVKQDEYAFGRVLLNIQTQCIDKNLLPEGNPLSFYTSTILVEIYKETSKGDLPSERTVLIPGILTSDGLIKNNQWKKVGFEKVNPKEVEFPEGVSHEGVSKGALVKGELKFVFDMDYEAIEKIGIFPGTKAAMTFGEIYLYQAGRKEDIDNPRLVNIELRSLANHDLRFSKYREEVYALLDLEPNVSYYDLSSLHGCSLDRFYRE